jgi:hypothetical protein
VSEIPAASAADIHIGVAAKNKTLTQTNFIAWRRIIEIDRKWGLRGREEGAVNVNIYG